MFLLVHGVCGGKRGWGLNAEFTAAVLLVVELVFTKELVAAVLEAAFTPILWPEKRCDVRTES